MRKKKRKEERTKIRLATIAEEDYEKYYRGDSASYFDS